MENILKLFASFLLIFCLILACDSTSTNSNVEYYEGITGTLPTSAPFGEEDTTDWVPNCYKISGFGKNFACFNPAYPNPTVDNSNFNIHLTTESKAIIYLKQHTNSENDTLFVGNLKKGFNIYLVELAKRNYERGKTVRVFIELFELEGDRILKSHGDIKLDFIS